MFEQVVPVNLERHGGKKIRPFETYGFAKNTHISALMIREFPVAAASYPIVFLEQPGADDFLAVALLGFKPGDNLYVDEDGKWSASYVPAMLRRYPFTLARTEDNDRFTVCVDEASGLLGDDVGEPLFSEGGEASSALDRAKTYLIELQQMEAMTATFCRKMKEHNLFAPLNLRVRDGSGLRNVTGCYAVNEERLNSLTDEVFLELRKSQYLPVIYSHLISLAQIERLTSEQARRTAPSAGEGEAERKSA